MIKTFDIIFDEYFEESEPILYEYIDENEYTALPGEDELVTHLMESKDYSIRMAKALVEVFIENYDK
jgi:hypothetical protein